MALAHHLDENVRGPLWRAVQPHNIAGRDPLDALRVGDMPDLPPGTDDAALLLWAEGAGRILVSLDRSTLPRHLAEHLQAGHKSPGIFMVGRRTSVQQVVSFLVAAAYASDSAEWQDRVEYLT